jgi:phosphoesterase RecJ-like protein
VNRRVIRRRRQEQTGSEPPPSSISQSQSPFIVNNSFHHLAGFMLQYQRFIVASHYRPDGDAIGSTLATALCLRELGKEVFAWNEDGLPEKFRFLPGSEMLTMPPSEPQEAEVLIIVDTAVKERVGKSVLNAALAPVCMNIDHHVSNPAYGDLNCVIAGASATGEVLYEMFVATELPLTSAMADNLYAAISTDTGSFQYPSTTARTYEIGAELIRKGVRLGEMAQALYESQPRRRIDLLKTVLADLAFDLGDRVASFSLPRVAAEALGIIPDDTEGLIDVIRSVQGVVVAAFFEELPDGRVRVSLRSKDPRADVCAVATEFGGGGHVLAAGIRMSGPLSEARARVIAAVEVALEKIQPVGTAEKVCINSIE